MGTIRDKHPHPTKKLTYHESSCYKLIMTEVSRYFLPHTRLPHRTCKISWGGITAHHVQDQSALSIYFSFCFSFFFFHLGVHGFRTHGFHTERARLAGLEFQHSTCKTRVHYILFFVFFFSFSQSKSPQTFKEEFQFKFVMKYILI